MKTYTHLTDEEFLREVEHVTGKAYVTDTNKMVISLELITEIVKRLREVNWDEEVEELRERESALEQTIEDLEEKLDDLKEDLEKCQ